MPQVNGFNDGFGLQNDRIGAVRKPPTTFTYSPSYVQNYGSIYGPAAVVTISAAARRWLEWLRGASHSI
jgi:hypothetical protein